MGFASSKETFDKAKGYNEEAKDIHAGVQAADEQGSNIAKVLDYYIANNKSAPNGNRKNYNPIDLFALGGRHIVEPNAPPTSNVSNKTSTVNNDNRKLETNIHINAAAADANQVFDIARRQVPDWVPQHNSPGVTNPITS